MDGGPKIQIEANATRDTSVECKAIDIPKCERSGAEDIDQVSIIGKSFRKANDHFAFGITQGDVSGGDQLIVATG